MKTLPDDAGRIQLPDSVQKQLGVKPGDELALKENNGSWSIKGIELSKASGSNGGDDDLNWEELDYHSVPLAGSRKKLVRIEHHGRLKPMFHPLEQE